MIVGTALLVGLGTGLGPVIFIRLLELIAVLTMAVQQWVGVLTEPC